MKIILRLTLAVAAFFTLQILQAQTYFQLSSGPFSQNWTNTGMITVTNDWSGVPSMIGYRGDDLVTSTGVDPQTILAPGTTTPVNVNANQTNPNTYTAGGNTEFEITDPVVAFQGSGTADAPFIMVYLNTVGVTSIHVQYNLRDIDGSTDNSIQPVALQYRIGESGDFINIPEGFVADASTGPSLATLVTPMNVLLPTACENQAQIQLRWITSNAVGNDELIGIDDIVIMQSTTPTITVTSPVGGIQWRQGSTHDITWNSSNINSNVKIEYSSNASAPSPTWNTLVNSVAASSGSWTWAIPAGQQTGTDYKVRITDIPQTAIGLSGTFSIIPPPPSIANIAALRASTPGQEYTLTGEAILTFQQTFRNQKFIQDATGAILIDDNDNTITTTYNIGDGITGITGMLIDYSNGMMEFDPTINTNPASSTGNTVNPQVVTIPELESNFEAYESELIRINFCTFTDAGGTFANGTMYEFTDLNDSIGNFRTTFYNVDYIGTTIPSGYRDIIGIANSTTTSNQLITSRSLDDIISSSSLPAITVTSPNGGEYWQQGTTHNITWVSENFTGNVKIELTGSHPSVLAASVPNSGSYTWAISSSQAVGTDYKVKVSDAIDGSPYDESNAAFSIVAPYLLPDIVITEIMYNSPGDDEEWIELYNNSANDVDMENFRLIDSDPSHPFIVLPAGANLASGEYYTIEVATSGNFPFVPDFDGKGKFALNNTGGDQVKLYYKYGELIDSVKYLPTAPWPTGTNGDGASLTFCNPSLDNSLPENWSASTEIFLTLQNDTIFATPGSGCLNPPPAADFVGVPTSIFTGDFVQFTDLSTNDPISWLWSFSGGTPQSSTEQNPSIQYNTFGVYSVTLTATNANGSGTMTKTDYIHVDIDGVKLVSGDKVSIFPNPASGKISVTNPTGGPVTVSIYTLLGSMVADIESAADLIPLDLSRVPGGVYLIKITDNEGKTIAIRKLILK